jgi:SHS2 domain-containing protein
MPAEDAPSWLREIDHTGDVGLRVRADTLPQLFERAAAGAFYVLSDPSDVAPAESTSLIVRGRDREALLLRWLSELNYRHTVDRRLYTDFAVSSVTEEGDEWVLEATVRGEPIDPDRHVVYTEIKAVTFHGLAVQPTDDGWEAQVIFDM